MPRERTVYDAVAEEVNKLRPDWNVEAVHDRVCFVEGKAGNCYVTIGDVDGPWGVSVARPHYSEASCEIEGMDSRFQSQSPDDSRHIAAITVALADELLQAFPE